MSRSASSGKRNILTNAAANWLGYAGQILVAFFLMPILNGALGNDRYGIWSLVESILAYLVLLDFGIGASVVRFVARFEATRDYDKVNRVFSTSVCIFLAAGLLAMGLAVGLAFLVLPCFDKIPAELGPEARWLLIILGVNLGLGLPLKVFSCLLDALGRYPVQNAVRLGSLLARTSLLLIVARSEGGLVPLACVIMGCNLLEYGTLSLIAWRYLPELRFSFSLADREMLKTMRGYSVDAFLAMIAGRLSFQTAAIVIGAFLGSTPITFFAIASRLVEYSKDSFRALTQGLTPAVSVMEAHGDNAGIQRVLFNATRYVLWMVLPLQAGLMILGQPFLRLWMKHDLRIAENSYVPLLILATPLVLALPQMVAARILYGMGQLRWYARAALAEALVNLLLSLALVVPLGIEGVALGTALPNLLGSSALVYYICRTLDVRMTDYLRSTFLAPLAAVLLLGAGWWAVVQGSGVTSWLTLIATGAGGLAAYLMFGLLVEVGPRRIGSFLQNHLPLNPASQARAEPALAQGAPLERE
jgi:O-antigen/teichoic acid export membrane protein